MLPVLVIPFLTMLLWAIGVIKSDAAETKPTSKGLLTTVPQAIIKEDKAENKMTLYEAATRDSARQQAAVKADPVLHRTENRIAIDTNEEKMNRKISQIQRLIHATPTSSALRPTTEAPITPVVKVEHPVDPEMQQLNAMMDKILEIQHPDRAAEHPKNNSLAVSVHEREHSKTGFYSLNETKEEGFQNAIEATVPETQILEAGSTVKLLVVSDLFINGFKIPRNSFVFGIASLGGERLHIAISSIRYQNSILPVSLKVYDVDGLEGIYIPGSVSRDVVKETSGEALGSLGVTLDQSLASQAAGAGIQAAKSLFSKKIKQVKVTIRQGYKILLKDTNQKQ